ncbi:MAG TPA: hypothetical protein VIT44_07165 [Cyclobacteriaceae bacterium]
MRLIIVFSCIVLLTSCGKKPEGKESQLTDISPPDSLTTISTITYPDTPSAPPDEILKLIKPLSLPLNTENLPRNDVWTDKEVEQMEGHVLHPETVKLMGIRKRDSLELARVEPNMQLGDNHYWTLGKIGEQSDYVVVLVGSRGYQVNYSLITFTAEGKIIDHLRLSEETASEGEGYDTEAIIDSEGTISITDGQVYSDPYEILGPISETSYTINDSGKFIKGSTKESHKETTVDWYGIPNTGLLKMEEVRRNSVRFILTVGSGESCTGEVSGLALLQSGGKSFVFENSPEGASCTLTFIPESGKIVLREQGDGCEHGFKCQFAGTYEKIATEKISGVSYRVISWLGAPVDKFTCELQKRFSYEDDGFKCGVKPTEKWDPEKPSYYAGPVFPVDKVKMVHPLISNIDIVWEHGEIQTIRFTFENELSVESVQRIFNLPRTKEDWTTYYSYIFDISYGSLRLEDINTNDFKLLRVKSLDLVAFEHMGAGDIN